MVTEISLTAHSRVDSQVNMLSPLEETKTTNNLESSSKITFNGEMLMVQDDLKRRTRPVSPMKDDNILFLNDLAEQTVRFESNAVNFEESATIRRE